VRVLVIAAYASADGSYGGPVSVALDQAAALVEAGHEVTVVAGWDGDVRLDHPADLRLFRARKPLRTSFVGLIAPRLPVWVARNAARFDVVHVHLTRDLVTLPAAWAALRRRVPLVVQTHGQIRPERNRAQAAVDALLTRRVFREATAFLVLTDREDRDLRALGVDAARLHAVDNGVPSARARARPPEGSPLVLYSSRLADRKRPEVFVAAADIVARSRDDVRFELWGADEGALPAVLAEIDRRGLTDRCTYRGSASVEQARAHLGEASVFVLPSVAEPFPMALLEAFSAGLPSVITDQTGLSAAARERGAARVTDGSAEHIATAVLELLDDPAAWARTARSALDLADQRFAMPRIAARLVEVYVLSGALEMASGVGRREGS
jgi:glycosyltransferase involved in cell wall biosynthesis